MANHDRGRARKALRYGRERGVRVNIPAEVLEAAGIDPTREGLTYRTWAGKPVKAGTSGSILVRIYT